MTFKFKIEDRFAIAFILVAGCIANAIAYKIWGIRIVNDSARYFEYRDEILANGFFIDRHNIWYIGYVLILCLVKVMGVGNAGVILFQSLLSLTACVCVYLTASRLSASNLAGLISSLLFLLWLKISQWNMYVLCESSFTSFTVITAFLFLQPNRNWKLELASIASLLFTFFLKPSGISILVAGLTFYVFTYIKNPWQRAVVILLLLVIITGLCNRMLSTFTLVETYATGDVIYGCSLLPSQPCPKIFTLDASNITMPTAGQPLSKIFFFVIQNPWFFLKLTISKLAAFLLHIKPFYSIWHNLFIAFTLFPAYYFFAQGLRSIHGGRLAFVITYFVSACLIIMLTVEDWDGRFLMPLLPLIFIFAGIRINQLVERT